MSAFSSNQIVNGLIKEAQLIGHRDPLTRATYILRSALSFLTLPILLVIPGILLSLIGSLYVSFVPDMGEKYQKVLKMGLRDSWFYSYLMWQLSLRVPTQEVENL